VIESTPIILSNNGSTATRSTTDDADASPPCWIDASASIARLERVEMHTRTSG